MTYTSRIALAAVAALSLALSGCSCSKTPSTQPTACSSCSATQTCSNDKCVEICSTCKNTEICAADHKSCVPAEVSCSIDESDGTCASGYTCVGGIHYVDFGTSFPIFRDVNPTPGVLGPDAGTGKPIANPDGTYKIDTDHVQVSRASDAANAYCAPHCTTDADCPSTSYCLSFNTLNDEKTANDKPVSVCVHRQYCAPANSPADCYADDNTIATYYALPTGGRSGICTVLCDRANPSSCSQPDQKCNLEGKCVPTSGTCEVQQGQLCSACTNDQECGTHGVCNFTSAGNRFCQTSCTCDGIAPADIGKAIVRQLYAFPTYGSTYFEYEIKCGGGCPAIPNGLPTVCYSGASATSNPLATETGGWDYNTKFRGYCAPAFADVNAIPYCYSVTSN